MANSYLIDYFLSSCLLIWIIFNFFHTKSQLKEIQQADYNSVEVAINTLYKVYLPASLLPIAIVSFLLWRLYAVMIFTQSWGVGGCGLLVILAVYLVIANSLQTMLFVIRHSRYITITKSTAGKNIPPTIADDITKAYAR